MAIIPAGSPLRLPESTLADPLPPHGDVGLGRRVLHPPDQDLSLAREVDRVLAPDSIQGRQKLVAIIRKIRFDVYLAVESNQYHLDAFREGLVEKTTQMVENRCPVPRVNVVVVEVDRHVDVRLERLVKSSSRFVIDHPPQPENRRQGSG